MTLRLTSFALGLSLGFAACGGTVETPAPEETPACDPLVPRGPASPSGCCPSGCTPLDPPEGTVYCVHVDTGGAC